MSPDAHPEVIRGQVTLWSLVLALGFLFAGCFFSPQCFGGAPVPAVIFTMLVCIDFGWDKKVAAKLHPLKSVWLTFINYAATRSPSKPA